MRMRWIGACLLGVLVGIAGCRSRVAMPTGVAPEDKTTHLRDKIDLSVEDWLKLPRPELAKLAEEWTVTVGKQREAARNNPGAVQLLPRLHVPSGTIPFVEAKYSSAAGFSLPPYLKEGQKDTAVALHLARFGDGEAALKLAEATDKELRAKIETSRAERNYPLEWTRLVALALESAQLKLIVGEPDGATELVQLHRQLRSVLDAKTAAGALGAALLPRGRQALTLAAAAWRKPARNKIALAADIESALTEWGKLPDTTPGLTAGAKQSEVVRLLGGPVEGRAVVVHGAPAVQRALDLLALPLPGEGVTDILAFLDGRQALTELLVLYRPKIHELFPEPGQLALPLVEHGYASETPAPSPGLSRQTWTGGEATYDVALLTRGKVGGAVVRIGKAGAPAPAASASRNPRDFGAINLDRSFEQNRLAVAVEQAGNTLEIKDKDRLASITQPAQKRVLASVLLQREDAANLVAKVILRWPAEEASDALSRLAVPMWVAYGPARLESAEDVNVGQFLLSWEEDNTRLRLSLPFDDQTPALLAEDSRDASALPARLQAATQRDQRERQERLAAGKPHTRLARCVRLSMHGIDNLSLGMTRQQVQAVLPESRSIRVRPMADGLNVLFLSEPPRSTAYWPRQVFVRFGSEDRAVEIRVRYQEGPHPAGPGSPGLLDTLRAKPNGAPETLPAPWAGLWTDLPAAKRPVLYRWCDDLTCWTCQKDGGGSEVVLRDCPPEQPLGVQLPPLLFCSRGLEHCNLGDSLSEVRKHWNISKPLLAANGAEVLVMPAKSPYDVVLVWSDKDRVSRLIARHREPKVAKPQEIGAALQKAWAADIDHLGYLRRQDGPAGQVLQAYSWNDDQTRVRIFAQETAEGVRLFTEWRTWPIPAPVLAVAPTDKTAP